MARRKLHRGALLARLLRAQAVGVVGLDAELPRGQAQEGGLRLQPARRRGLPIPIVDTRNAFARRGIEGSNIVKA